ncbi:MAG: GNAT family N-acetyltransferase [Myxococcales bacterium]|nr:GNAT family N-acetyltransferase [Myxococcales bacterium]
MTLADLRFEVLQPSHDRANFSSGTPAIDEWFRLRASQDQRRHVAQVFVALLGEKVVGFYSLSMFTLSLDTLPPALAKKLPRYEAIPAAIVGRLARAESARGTGLGDLLLADAIKRILAASETVAAYAIVVDAKDERGKRFYEEHGFIALASRPRRLFLLTQTAAAALDQARR